MMAGLISGNRARELVIDDDRGNCGDEADGRRQQRFGDARRNDGEVGRLRFRNADEAIHDAPHGTKQADEWCGRADGGENAGAAVPYRVPAAMARPSRRLEMRSLMPDLSETSAESRELERRELDEVRLRRPAGCPSCSDSLGERRGGINGWVKDFFEAALGRRSSSSSLCEPHGPRHDGSKTRGRS